MNIYQPAAGRTCRSPGCSLPVRSKGLCSRHYDRAIRASTCGACGGPTARGAICRACYEAPPTPESKSCTRCLRLLPIGEFGIRSDGRGRTKIRARCRTCESHETANRRRLPGGLEHHREIKRRSEARLKADPERWFWRSLQRSARVLGLDWDVVRARVEAIGNTCEACGWTAPPGQPRVHLDHDHRTGQFRGLLCGTCNVAAGWAEHRLTPDVLAYLTSGRLG
jgi:hypothetical protein